jgi:outer membrane protein TolC
LSLEQALQIGARNSFEYQTLKEEVFKSALDLDLKRDEFRNTFYSQVTNLLSTNTTGERTVSGVETGGDLTVTRTLESGAELTTSLAVDLANLLTMGGASSVGIAGDATISIPLLRGSGKHIVTEPLTQAERQVVYAIWEFERFKETFAVSIASQYFATLRQLDAVKNNEENYRSLILSARRSRRLADAGRLQEVQVDQAVQNELTARQRWISAVESYNGRLDDFKTTLGLPPDAAIGLDKKELERLVSASSQLMEQMTQNNALEQSQETSALDARVELVPPNPLDAGPLEIDPAVGVRIALDSRLDLRVALGKVYDAQRAVVVAADDLGAELTLFGSAEVGEPRTVGSAELEDAKLRIDEGVYSALLTLDLPLERTEERNDYRKSFIELERAVRDVQKLEDQIKLAVRDALRKLLETRESLKIQSKAVAVAQKRVKSVNMFLEAGRVQVRDLLEAQEALLSAQNGLTAAAADYRIAELELQRDMGALKIDEKGLWQEYRPEARNNAEKEDTDNFSRDFDDSDSSWRSQS